MPADIGSLIFIDLLGMTMYPGSPFTGNIVKDAIQYLFIPSVFIILVIYMLVGRLAVPASKIRILVAVTCYLFIITSGYYKVFALLAGPYFIFLIFILGLLYFIPAHFGAGGGGGGGGGGQTHSGRALLSDKRDRELIAGSDRLAEEAYGFLPSGRAFNPAERHRIKQEIKDLDSRIAQYDRIIAKGGSDRAIIARDELIDRKLKLERILSIKVG